MDVEPGARTAIVWAVVHIDSTAEYVTMFASQQDANAFAAVLIPTTNEPIIFKTTDDEIVAYVNAADPRDPLIVSDRRWN